MLHTSKMIPDRSMISSIKTKCDDQFYVDLRVYCFVPSSYKTEIVLPVFPIKTNQFHVHDLYKTLKTTKKQSSNFGLI